MAVLAACTCGKSYELKDEFAGRLVKCPSCGESMRVPGHEVAAQADPVFDRDKFLLRQKHLAINQKYYVWDEQGNVLLFVERPSHLGKNLLAVGAFLVVLTALVLLAVGLGAAASQVDKTFGFILGAVLVVAALVVSIIVAVAMAPKRHTTIYRDDSRRAPLLEILQDKKWHIIRATYTVREMHGAPLAHLKKNYLYNLLRKRWECFGSDGRLAYVAMEDSIILSLLRRVLGPLLGLLRTNFIILGADRQRLLGEFNRSFTLLDRYVLDLSADPQRQLDRRIALAIGIMLDSGERR